MTDWQPMDTAPKGPTRFSGNGPIVALASDHGHRALGYWGKGIDGVEGWINPHDHLRMRYWNEFTWWMPLPDVPSREENGRFSGGSEKPKEITVKAAESNEISTMTGGKEIT